MHGYEYHKKSERMDEDNKTNGIISGEQAVLRQTSNYATVTATIMKQWNYTHEMLCKHKMTTKQHILNAVLFTIL